MHARQPPGGCLAVALLATVALLAAVPAVAAVDAANGDPTPATDPRPAAVVQPDDCELDDGSDRLRYLDDEYDYAAGLASDSAGDWTGGTVVPIGAHGDCSLAVTNGSAALTATRVDGQRGVLHATVDAGEEGALRVVTADGTTNASVTVENVGRPNDAALALVVRNGTTHRTRLTAPTGRFVDLTLRWDVDGIVRVALRDPARWDPDPETWDATVETGARNATWELRLRSRAYLDELAVGTRPESAPGDAGPGGGDPDEDRDLFPGPTPEGGYENRDPDGGGDGSSTPGGLVLGPLLALVGGGMYRFAYGLSRFGEQMDAIGSTTPASEVEPADWNVMLTKLGGAAVALVGVGWLLSALASTL